MTVVDFPEQKPPEFIFGPFTENRVVIEGRNIPYLTANKIGDDRVELIVDRRWSATFAAADAYQAAWLMANAMAVASGYPYLGADNKQMPFAPQVMQLGDVPGR